MGLLTPELNTGDNMASRSAKLRFTIKRFRSFLGTFGHSKRGLFGLILLLAFCFVALIAPGIAPHDPVNGYYVGGAYAVPEWFDKLFPGSHQSYNINLLANPGFNDPTSIQDFNITSTSNSIATYYVASIGSRAPGCLAVAFEQNVPGSSGSQVVNITKTFYYPYERTLFDFSAPAQFYVDGSTHPDQTNKVTLDVPVSISIGFERIENKTTRVRYDLLQYEHLIRPFELPLIPNPVTSPTTSWIPTDITKLSGDYAKGAIYNENTIIDINNDTFTKPAYYVFSIEITFLNSKSTKSGAETVVYVDDLNFKGLGTAYGLFGTDELGRDIYSQLIYGSRISLLVGLLAAFVSVAIGLVVGMVAGYQGGVVDEVLMRVTDALLVIPSLPLLLVLVAVLGSSLWNLIIVIGVLGWMGFARMIRSMILSLKERPYVEAAKAIGGGNVHIMIYHILPNVMALVYVTLAMTVPTAIVSEAALSWLGFFDPSVMSWGRMLHDIQEGLNIDKWWWVVPPGLLIAFVALSFILIGHALDEILNPKLRQRR
jgi:peptide/nickel transport system permease protein